MLYTSTKPNLIDKELRNLFNNNNIPKLDKLDKDSATGLKHDILESEVFIVLKNMKNNKFPGSDGYTVQFLTVFFFCILEGLEVICGQSH